MEDRCGASAAAKAACTTRQAVAQSAFGLLKDARTWGRLGLTKVEKSESSLSNFEYF